MKRKKSKVRRLHLPECLDISAAAPLAKSFHEIRGAKLVVGAGHVRCVGAQCIQVLLSVVATWKADKISLRIVDPSPAMVEALQLLGIAPTELMIEDASQ